MNYPEHAQHPSISRRLFEFLRVELRAVVPLFFAELLYVRTHFISFPIAFLATLLRVPVIQELNGPYEDIFIAWPSLRRASQWISWLVRKQLQWADAIITVTPSLSQWVKKETGKRRIFVIPNAADTGLFKPHPKTSPGLPANYILFFGSLARWQGVDLLLKGAAHSRWPPDLSLVIAGDGAEREIVVREASINPRLHYLGRVRHEDLPSLISKSIAVAIPKNNLGDRALTGLSPIKLYEALACGTPVIVTDFPGQADLVRENGCGIVFPPDDLDAYVAAVVLLCENQALRKKMGEQARLAILRGHTWQQRANATASVLEGVLRRANRSSKASQSVEIPGKGI